MESEARHTLYRCIGSKRDRPGFNAEIQITFWTVHGVYAEKMFFLILTRNRKQLIYYREIREYVRIYLEFSAQTAYKNNLYSLGLMIKQALNFGTCYKDQKNVKPVGSLLWKEASQELIDIRFLLYCPFLWANNNPLCEISKI